jgi:hypothetical protein
MEHVTTRGGLLLGGLAAIAGGTALGRHGAAAAAQDDTRILGLFLTLERLQEALYRQASRAGVKGELARLAAAVGGQEREHVALLERRLGGDAPAPPRTDFGALRSPGAFRTAAIEVEEAAIAAYIGQAANLSRPAMIAVTTLISVEARQVAWLRDLAGLSPAPHAADPARPAEDVLDELRKKGYLK